MYAVEGSPVHDVLNLIITFRGLITILISYLLIIHQQLLPPHMYISIMWHLLCLGRSVVSPLVAVILISVCVTHHYNTAPITSILQHICFICTVTLVSGSQDSSSLENYTALYMGKVILKTSCGFPLIFGCHHGLGSLQWIWKPTMDAEVKKERRVDILPPKVYVVWQYVMINLRLVLFVKIAAVMKLLIILVYILRCAIFI